MSDAKVTAAAMIIVALISAMGAVWSRRAERKAAAALEQSKANAITVSATAVKQEAANDKLDVIHVSTDGNLTKLTTQMAVLDAKLEAANATILRLAEQSMPRGASGVASPMPVEIISPSPLPIVDTSKPSV